ncbi:lanthionine synthetase C family protein [Acrocarpospora sp. B8E8]|uniref:lanthionine synthetase C family protein n=1 Tax=Acrocarpospora sp. B8E8 TaxID=3153572 RepID=UPI00325EF1D3
MSIDQAAGPVTLTADQAADQSLATGAVGTALLSVERALAGSGGWRDAHERIRQVTAGPIDAAAHAGLYYGAPAIAFLLHAVGTGGHPRYRAAATTLDYPVLRLIRRRLTAAENRMKRGGPAQFREYDLFYGLTGLGALLLHRLPGSDTFADVLRYLIRLTEPRREDGEGGLELPGWWVPHDPDRLLPTPGGHANLGMAHGAAGVLALLALGISHGRIVDGQAEAVETLGSWFDRWRQDSADGPWWPQWITREELRTGRLLQKGPVRPSWCYGAAGIARALQLAGLATGDTVRRATAEQALAACLADRQLDRITEAGLCHGLAGVYQTAFRAASDAGSPAIAQRLPALASVLIRRTTAPDTEGEGAGFLTGSAGVSLALETARHTAPPCSGWDTCLLIA